MRRFRRNFRKSVKALAFSFVAAAVFTGTASARPGSDMPPGYAPEIEAELALIGAPSFSPITTPADMYAGELEPSQAPSVGPITSQAELRAGWLEPRQHLADSYRVYADRSAGMPKPAGFPQPEVTSAAVSSGGIDRDEVVRGLSAGLILAIALAITAVALRQRSRAVHA